MGGGSLRCGEEAQSRVFVCPSETQAEIREQQGGEEVRSCTMAILQRDWQGKFEGAVADHTSTTSMKRSGNISTRARL